MGLVKAIACRSDNGVIGASSADRGLPWRWPEDLARFRRLTDGGVLLFGRTTWDLLGHPRFPGREVAVVTSRPGVAVSNPLQPCMLFTSPEAAVAWYACDKRVLWVCGGERLYRSTMRYWDGLELSVLRRTVPGDAYMPELPKALLLEACEASADGLGTFMTYRREDLDGQGAEA